VVDQGKPPAIRPRGPRKAKAPAAAVVEIPASVFKPKLRLSEQLANLIRMELNRCNLTPEAAADKVGLHANVLRRLLKGTTWPSEDTLVKVCDWLKYDVKLIGRD
jgi:hypothetical protein